MLQNRYMPVEQKEYKTPVFLNESYEEVDSNFNLASNLTLEEQDLLCDEKYKYNVVQWTCRPLGCQKLVGKPTLKLICSSGGYTEDVRVAMEEECEEAARQMELTVVFQLVSKTTGEYYLGRSGKIVT
jgi:hypothetical protein